MSRLAIIAHRGATVDAPENTLAAFEKAIELGADAVELDVRLTRDGVPVVYHYFYLDVLTSLAGPLFQVTAADLAQARFIGSTGAAGDPARISTLAEVLHTIGGRIGLEIEIKGPEPEAPAAIGAVLRRCRPLWETIEITSYEPLLLREMRLECPGIPVDLLVPRSEPWMRPDVVAYAALQRARLAGARAVHLHPTQLEEEVVETIRAGGIDVHAWDVNDGPAMALVVERGIDQMCTDRLTEAVRFRAGLAGRPEDYVERPAAQPPVNLD